MMTCEALRTGGSVAIVGAGPAGLTLARLLQIRGFSVRVFEREASPTARNQGGSVDMRADSGGLALRRAGLGDAFESVSRREASAFRMLDSQGETLTFDRADFDPENEEEAGPEIDRGDLRALLLDSLAPATILWDHALREVVPESDGKWRLEFDAPASKGAPIVADLVIGADGTRSRVRARLTPVEPVYYGVTMFDATIREDLWRGSEIDRFVGEGAVLLGDGRQTIFVQRCARDLVRLYFSLTVPEDWPRIEGFRLEDTERVLAAIREAYRDWSPELMAMLTQIQGGFQRWALHAMPPDRNWETRPGLTILGDASHVMPPFTGKGVNLALLDALELADGLTVTPSAPVTEVLRAFEAQTAERSRREIGECLGVGRESYGINLSPGMVTEGVSPSPQALSA